MATKKPSKSEDVAAALRAEQLLNLRVLAAASRGDLDALRQLVSDEFGGRLDWEDDDGHSALTRAAQEGHAAVVAWVLERGLDVAHATRAHGNTALHLARAHPPVVRLLLDAGANANAQNHNLDTPLMLACHGGHLETVELLLGATPAAEALVANRINITTLMCAAMGGNIHVLTRVAAVPGVRDTVNVQNVYGHTALHAAVEAGAMACVKFLLHELGADPHVRNKRGALPSGVCGNADADMRAVLRAAEKAREAEQEARMAELLLMEEEEDDEKVRGEKKKKKKKNRREKKNNNKKEKEALERVTSADGDDGDDDGDDEEDQKDEEEDEEVVVLPDQHDDEGKQEGEPSSEGSEKRASAARMCWADVVVKASPTVSHTPQHASNPSPSPEHLPQLPPPVHQAERGDDDGAVWTAFYGLDPLLQELDVRPENLMGANLDTLSASQLGLLSRVLSQLTATVHEAALDHEEMRRMQVEAELTEVKLRLERLENQFRRQ